MGRNRDRKKRQKAARQRAFNEKARKQKENAAKIDADNAAARKASGGVPQAWQYAGQSGDDTNLKPLTEYPKPVTKTSGAATSRDQYTNDPEYDAYRKEHNAQVRREGKGNLLPDYGNDIKVNK